MALAFVTADVVLCLSTTSLFFCSEGKATSLSTVRCVRGRGGRNYSRFRHEDHRCTSSDNLLNIAVKPPRLIQNKSLIFHHLPRVPELNSFADIPLTS